MKHTKMFVVTMYVRVESWIQSKFTQIQECINKFLQSYHRMLNDNENESIGTIPINIVESLLQRYKRTNTLWHAINSKICKTMIHIIIYTQSYIWF